MSSTLLLFVGAPIVVRPRFDSFRVVVAQPIAPPSTHKVSRLNPSEWSRSASRLVRPVTAEALRANGWRVQYFGYDGLPWTPPGHEAAAAGAGASGASVHGGAPGVGMDRVSAGSAGGEI